MTQPSKSRRALVDAGARLLAEGPHPEWARRDAEELLLHLFRKDARERNRAWLFANLLSPITDRLEAEFLALIDRRSAGEPLQYITGEADFYRMQFHVSPAVLIPRPETELLVERAVHLVPGFMPRSDRLIQFRIVSTNPRRSFAYAAGAGAAEPARKKSPQAPRILDVGTGSGAIAISIAHDWAETEITATDLSPAALDVARENAVRLGFADRIRFLEGDLLAPVIGERFEIIVCNPPYVPSADRATLAVEVREYEPALALFAGSDGLDVCRRLIPAAFAALTPGGFVALEIGYGQQAAIRDLFVLSGFGQIEFVSDLQGIPRVACARRS